MRLPGRPAADLLYEARARERAACIPEAIERFEAAIATAERTGERAVLAEALRRLAVVRHHRNETAAAWELCNRSYTVAGEQGSDFLAAEALNTLGGLRSEEHTSELQSPCNLVCRLLLEKKKFDRLPTM